MFTGIIESLGEIVAIRSEGSNKIYSIESGILDELKVDQSIAHNGVCLTVSALNENSYEVTAVDETLIKSNLGELMVGDQINLERSLKVGDRLDGHMVQGHVDTTAKVKSIEEKEGSWVIRFTFQKFPEQVLVEKGSCCINGVSLTVFDISELEFSVTIIPYTWEHTNFHKLKVDSSVNIEFDVLGKYAKAWMERWKG
jgi:riboflavin synthase